jgi:hypothetical protein
LAEERRKDLGEMWARGADWKQREARGEDWEQREARGGGFGRKRARSGVAAAGGKHNRDKLGFSLVGL